MAVILPFEEDYFRQRGLDATYVGHPLFDALATRPADPAEVDRIRAQGAPRVAILPGSRKHVIREVLPGQLAVAGAVCRAFPDTAIGVSVAGTAAEPLVRAIADSCGLPVKLYRERNAELLTAADLTLVASGTATLEVAYYGSPMIVMYNSSRLLYHLMGRWVVRLKQFSLVNILAGTELVPEFMPYYRSTAPIAAKAIELLSKPDRRSDMRRKLAELLEPIRKPGATRRTADLLLAMLNTPTGR
jgi:lipid-A-disaccharide synthase